MTTNWIIVSLDLWIMAVWLAQGLWFISRDEDRFNILAAGFLFATMGYSLLLIGDIYVAFGAAVKDHWILGREWRALSWRIAAAVGFTTIGLVLRFGFRTDGYKKRKR